MKIVLLHPGTQHSRRLACQLNRLDLLYKFVTGIGFSKSSKLLPFLPKNIKGKLANRILECSIPPQQIKAIPIPELIWLFWSSRRYEMEKALNLRNESFQRRIDDQLIASSDGVIGFDTSSWISSKQAAAMQKPFYLDQSIAHPKEKSEVFEKLRKEYPEWSEDIPEKSALFIEQEQLEYATANKIIVASTFTKQSLIKNGVLPSRIIINPYGVGSDFFHSREYKRSSRKVRFVFLGYLGARKGLPHLINVWMINHLYEKAELWLAGPAGNYAKSEVEKTPGMFYKGRLSHNEIPGLLEECDCLVFPSFFEGFGQVILESMAAGLPVITTEATVGPDIIENNVDGFLYQSGDGKALGDIMLTLANDRSLSYSMGLLAQKKAKSFTWDSYGDRWKQILLN